VRSDAPDEDRLPRSHLLGLVLSTALVPLGSTMIAVALPAIGSDLGTDPAALTQWLVNSYLVVGIVLLSPAGKLGDLWGARRALSLGQVLFAVGAGLGFVGASLPWLVGARVTMAAGGALIGPATMALLRNTTAPSRRARVFGFFGAVMGLSAALGPPLGGILVQTMGWRSIFVANLPILATGALLLRGLARPPAAPRGVRFDWVGSALLGAGLSAAVAASKASGSGALALGASAALLLPLFLRWERSVADPVLDPGLFRIRAFTAGGAIVALHNLAMYALLFQLPLWFGSLLQSSAAETGRVLLGMMLAMVVCAPLGGRLSERLGARGVALLGTALSAGAMLALDAHRILRPQDALIQLVLLGLGLGLTSAPAQAAALSAVEHRQSGMASGALSTLRYLGGVVGIGVLGVVLGGGTEGTVAGAAAHQTALRLFAVALLLALLPAALLPGRRTSGEEPLPTPI
jgi:MFS family permease